MVFQPFESSRPNCTEAKPRCGFCLIEGFLCAFDRVLFFLRKFALGCETTHVFRIHADSVARMDARKHHAVSLLIEERRGETLPAAGVPIRVETLNGDAANRTPHARVQILKSCLGFLRVRFKRFHPLAECANGSFKRFSVAAFREAGDAAGEEKRADEKIDDEHRKSGKNRLGANGFKRKKKVFPYHVHSYTISGMFRRRRVYMDFAAATPLHPSVRREMERGYAAYGNPSAAHDEARLAQGLLEEARTRLARTLSVKPESLTFTGSGTESNNLAIHGVLEALITRGAKPENLHIVTSAFEHPSVNDQLLYWAERGVAVSYAEPNGDGIVTPEAVMRLIRPETVLVSIVAVQSELGEIQPLRDIAHALRAVREKRAQKAQKLVPESPFPIMHSDASQSPLFLDSAPSRLGVDMATYDAQKVMGPKGVGVLYKRSSITIEPLMKGGKQERGLRPGTENVAGALGMARAMELAIEGRNERIERVTAVRDYFVSLLARELPQVSINGGMKQRIANNLNISIPGADGDYLAVLMDKEGIAVSPRSACIASGSPSRGVSALGKTEEEARRTLRFSFSPWVTKRDARRAVSALKKSLAIVTYA